MSAAESPSFIPAERLEGMTLDDGWRVGRRITETGGTGGHFSVRYEVIDEAGRVAFLKALNIAPAINDPEDMIPAIQRQTTEFLFERNLVARCADMSRIVKGIAYGQVSVPGSQIGKVPYLIFEKADCDVSIHLNRMNDDVTTAWKLRCLHHVSTGIAQLHRLRIAHRDIKPSNVLVFREGTKLADLGCAAEFGVISPRDRAFIPGDKTYAPLELWYGYRSSDWDEACLGYDLFLLGNLVVFLFCQSTINAMMAEDLKPEFCQRWFRVIGQSDK